MVFHGAQTHLPFTLVYMLIHIFLLFLYVRERLCLSLVSA